MSGVKHTPGPDWRIGQMSMSKRDWASLNSGEPITIVQNGPDVIAAVWGDNDDEARFARLIASAPDLLEAAEEFCRRVEAGEIRSKRSYAAFKAAIARARGEHPQPEKEVGNG